MLFPLSSCTSCLRGYAVPGPATSEPAGEELDVEEPEYAGDDGDEGGELAEVAECMPARMAGPEPVGVGEGGSGQEQAADGDRADAGADVLVPLAGRRKDRPLRDRAGAAAGGQQGGQADAQSPALGRIGWGAFGQVVGQIDPMTRALPSSVDTGWSNPANWMVG